MKKAPIGEDHATLFDLLGSGQITDVPRPDRFARFGPGRGLAASQVPGVMAISDQKEVLDMPEIDRQLAIFGPLADMIQNLQKGDNLESRAIKSTSLSDRCNCSMEQMTVKNDLHDDACELWFNRLFWDGDYKWDGSGIQRLIVDFKLPTAGHSPWDNADEYIWDGDNPIISKATAAERQCEDIQVNALEEEAFAAYLVSGEDEYGWVQLPCGSWADQESRVTYRITKDDEGKDCWIQENWDDEVEDLGAPFCDCPTPKQYFCGIHKVKRTNPNGAWEHDTSTYTYSYSKCSHAFDRFILPNADAHVNVDIRISGARRHTEDTTPDLGVYASNCWNPDAPAIFIPWQDYGLPTVSFTRAANALIRAWDAAKAGDVVEFGCMGGHGRTGTMLACIAILADPTMSGNEAVAHVRKVHCHKAVETTSQEWYVRWFAAFVRDENFSETQPKSGGYADYGYASDDDWGYGTQSYPKGTTALQDAINDTSIEYTEILADRTITKYKSGKLVVEYKTGGSTTTYVKRDNEVTESVQFGNHGVPGSTCVWGEHCTVANCNYYHPSAGKVTPTPVPSAWCESCKRTVYTEHNNNCPKGQSPAVGAPTWTPDGNVAPGATANARRQAQKRQRRQEAARRSKQKRNNGYVNSRSR